MLTCTFNQKITDLYAARYSAAPRLCGNAVAVAVAVAGAVAVAVACFASLGALCAFAVNVFNDAHEYASSSVTL
jgi:hypothetical protein